MSSFEHESSQLFANLAVALGGQRSVGLIYGLLFANEDPLCLDDIAERLQISRGSTSNGLRFLRSIGAIKPRRPIGQRREHFEPELSLRKLVNGFLHQTVEPHLDNAPDWIARLQSAAGNEKNGFAHERIATLERWHQRSDKLLPLVLRVLSS